MAASVSGVNAGKHSYEITFLTGAGETTAGLPSNQVTTTAGNLQVNLTNIPLGPSNVIQRNIYRTVAGDTGSYLLVVGIADNTTTTYSDTTADSSLTTAMPAHNTSAPLASVVRANAYGVIIPQAKTGGKLTWGFDCRGVDQLYDVPITMELLIYVAWASGFAFTAGNIITAVATDGATYRYRCTTAGTSGVSAPAFNPQAGSTTADGATLIWTNEGTNVLAALETSVTNISDAPNWVTNYLTCVLPVSTLGTTDSYVVQPRLKFYNSTSTYLTTLAPIDISYRDGLTDGDPRKANHGSQWVVGSYGFPFFNKETTTTLQATYDYQGVIWSEIADANTWRGVNNYNMPEAAGYPTCARFVGGRLMIYKRRGMWQFYLTSDPDNPILPEVPARIGIGCLGPRAADTMDDEIFWLGEYEVYRLKVGYEPRVLAGVAMREAIFNRGSNWVESQATYNMPLLAVDRKNREVWCYTQKGKLYCYHLGDEATPSVFRPYVPETGMWTEHDIDGQEIRAMAWNPTTQEMMFSIGGGGAVRFDPSQNQKDQIDNTSATYTVSKDVIWKPVELFAPRYDAILEGIGVYHVATASQTNQTLTLYISTNRG